MAGARLAKLAGAANRVADWRIAPVVKKSLFVVVLFYLLGVFGVASGYLSNEWDSDWSFGAQLFDALKMGATWPLLVIDLMVGA